MTADAARGPFRPAFRVTENGFTARKKWFLRNPLLDPAEPAPRPPAPSTEGPIPPIAAARTHAEIVWLIRFDFNMSEGACVGHRLE